MTFKFLNKFLNKVSIASILVLTCITNTANAGLINIGALSSNDDGSTMVITDTLNNLEWLRWDELADLTYIETLAAISTVGSHPGWQIAGVEQANLFINALFNDTNPACINEDIGFISCGDTGTVTSSGFTPFSSAEYTALLGDSSARGASSVDAAWFYDDTVADGKAGFLNLESGTRNEKYNEFGNIALTDTYAGANSESIGWLVYRSGRVPEPSTLIIFVLGIVLLGARYLRK